MDEILEQLAASVGVPSGLLERAAAARAAVSGATAEDVARAWAGEAPAPAAAPPPAAAPAPAPAATAAAPEAATAQPAAPSADEEAAAPPGVEILGGSGAPADEEAAVDTARPREGALAGFPAWLTAAFLIIPLIALGYVLIAPNGPGCGTSGQLAIDQKTGVAENCDGTEFGVETVSFFSLGQELYTSAGCAACHGPDGGGGTGPAFAGGAVLVVFPQDVADPASGSCREHIDWVALGTTNWPEPTYGATQTALGASGAVMPGFADRLTPQELAAVVIYERVQYGGQLLLDAETDCAVDELEEADE